MNNFDAGDELIDELIDDSTEHDLIDDIADEIVTRQQAGETPTLDEYCQKHPELQAELRELFPMLTMLKDARSSPDYGSGSTTYPNDIGGYRIVGELGRGGMGIVFEAEHQGLGRRVALKVLPPRLAGREQARTRFEREERAIARLHHTNIVPLFEVGEDGEHFFFAMQLIRGKSVQELIEELHAANHGDQQDSSDPLQAIKAFDHAFRWNIDSRSSGSNSPIAKSDSGSGRDQHFQSIAHIGFQAANALGYAHGRGIIHRDVKPSNLLLDDSGIVWVTDFGLAKTNEEDSTQSGEFLGTLRYMAPERFRDECDERADIYGLGLTLYELIAMQPAFQSSDRLRLIGMINKTDPPRLRSLNPRVPRDLETIVMKAIDKDPRSRYRSAAELGDDLYRFINDQPIKARRHSLPEQFVRWSRKNKGLAASFFSIGVLLFLGILGLAYISVVESDLRQAAEFAQGNAESALKLAQQREKELVKTSEDLRKKGAQLNAQSKQLQRNLYIAEINLAGQAFSEVGGMGRVKEIVSRWAQRDPSGELRDWEWFYLRSLYDRELFTLDHGVDVRCVRLSPDGKWIAFGDVIGR
ncbi:MAG: serine/threonine protein kinase, partial [Pirellulales bacterium]|nr:serine/threonine protein kinase [Pirellulales bacterium]